MVSTDYTVSTAAQLLGRMPPVRISGSKSRSNATSAKHVKAADHFIAMPQPTKPLPPTPAKTVRVRASRSSDVLPIADRVKIKSGFSDAVVEEEVVTLPKTVYSPTTPTAKDNPVGPTTDLYVRPKYEQVPVLEAPVRKSVLEPSLLKGSISQYYEYITPPTSLLGRTGSRRERKASHTPSSSGGSDIYFSPIDATSNQAFLSSPQPSPPISPSDVANSQGVNSIVEKTGALTVEDKPSDPRTVKAVGFADAVKPVEQQKITLTLSDVDRLSTALAATALVQMRVRKSHLDDLPADMTATASDRTTDRSAPAPKHTAPPTPPLSETSTSDNIGGIALIETKVEGAPISLTSSEAFLPGRCTHLTLPYGLTSTSRLRIETPSAPSTESKIILQSLFAVLNRQTGAHELTLLAETDVTPSFARAALTELSHHNNLTLDDLEIATPTVSSRADDESIDWCTVDRDCENPTVVSSEQPSNDLLETTLTTFSTTFSAETCTMQTLTLLSELARLQSAHRTFLILQPTRFDAQGGLAAVKVPLISQAMRHQFAHMDDSSDSVSSTTPSSSGGLKGRQFREAVIAAVAPRFVHGEEFETFVGLQQGSARVRARCVPLASGGAVARWVCFLGGEYDVPY
ncbi:hypothetical protein Q7P37_004705 [Cladosporium fusiforme]